MLLSITSFFSSALVVLFDDDRAIVDDALHEHLHLGQDGHAGHALGMQDLHNKVLGMVLSSDRAGTINMKAESSRRRLRGEHGGVQQVVGALAHQPAHVLGQQQQTRPRD